MIQGPEFFMILLVALIVLGPSRIPDTARTIGRWVAELRRAASDLRAGLEAEVGDISEIRQQFQGPVQDVRKAMTDVSSGMQAVVDPKEKPISGPTPADAMRDLEEIERTGGPLSDAPGPVAGSDPEPADGGSEPEPADGGSEPEPADGGAADGDDPEAGPGTP